MNNGANVTTKHKDEEHFVPLTLDWLFVDCMQNEKVLQGFLSAVIGRPISKVENIWVRNRYLPKDGEDNKQGILDIRTLVIDVGDFDIELQVKAFEFWNERSIFYSSKMFVEGVRKGSDYDQCRKVIHIGILGFNLCEETDYFHSVFHLREDYEHFVYSDLLEFHVIELGKINCTLRETDRMLHKWATLIAAESEEERMNIEQDPYIEEAMKELERLSNDPAKREEYDQRLENLMDYRAQIKTFENIGLKRGLEQGRELGRELGLEQGLERGRQLGAEESKIKFIKNMLANQIPHDQIAQLAETDITLVKRIAGEATSK